MTALIQAATVLRTRQVSDFGSVAIFSLVGLTLSLLTAHFGIGTS
jgi:hypothetical protein